MFQNDYFAYTNRIMLCVHCGLSWQCSRDSAFAYVKFQTPLNILIWLRTVLESIHTLTLSTSVCSLQRTHQSARNTFLIDETPQFPQQQDALELHCLVKPMCIRSSVELRKSCMMVYYARLKLIQPVASDLLWKCRWDEGVHMRNRKRSIIMILQPESPDFQYSWWSKNMLLWQISLVEATWL